MLVLIFHLMLSVSSWVITQFALWFATGNYIKFPATSYDLRAMKWLGITFMVKEGGHWAALHTRSLGPHLCSSPAPFSSHSWSGVIWVMLGTWREGEGKWEKIKSIRDVSDPHCWAQGPVYYSLCWPQGSVTRYNWASHGDKAERAKEKWDKVN